MKSRGERTRGRSHGSSSHSLRERKPWTFYKLMLSPDVQSKKLRIPEAFTRAFSDELSGATTAIITGPCGETWEVALVNEDDQLWICEGWQEFVEHFSIGFAYFLLFLYEGALKFKVDIFSPTACEIFNPCNACNREQGEPCHSNPSADQDFDNANVVSTGASSTTDDSDIELVALDSEGETHLPGREEPMSYNNDVVSDRSVGSLLASDDMKLDTDEGSTHSSKMNNANRGTPSVGNSIWSEPEALIEALASVGFSMPKNPFFVTPVRKYNIFKGCFMRIPIDFARQSLNCKTMKTVNLEAPNGKQWEVQCAKVHDTYRLSRGWIGFARANGLKVGDICVFELTDALKCVLKVHVGTQTQVTTQKSG